MFLNSLQNFKIPDDQWLESMGPSQGMGLFEHSALRLHPGFSLTEANRPSVIRICRLVEGMPLALLLAAAWTKLLTLAEIATQIERSFTFLQADLQNLPPRQRSLQAVFNHSWQLLSPREQNILAQLSIFQGGFDAEAAQAVTGAELIDLLTLVEKYLLHRSSTGRYEIHELLRQFAAQKLAITPDDETVARHRHSLFYATFLHRRETDLKGARQKEALAELKTDDENIRLAWGWMAEQRVVEQLEWAVNSLGIFYEWQARYEEGEIACRRATERLQTGKSGEEMRVLAKVRLWQSIFNRHLGHSELAEQLAQQSLRLLDQPTVAGQDTRSEQAAILLEIGRQTGNLSDSISWFEQALALYRALADAWGTAQALYLLGKQLIDQPSHYDEGHQALAESLRIRQSLGDQRGIAETLQRLGFDATLRGQAETSEQLMRQSLTIYRKLDDPVAVAVNLMHIAHDLADNHGQFAEAYNLVEEASNIVQNLGNPYFIAQAKVNLSWAYLHLGRYKPARIQGQSSLDLSRVIKDPEIMSFALWKLGDVALADEDYTEAEALLRGSIAIHQEISYQGRLRDVRVCLGYALLGLGKVGQAQQCLADSIRESLTNQQFLTQMWALPLAALIAIAQEAPKRAVEYYALASRYPYIANSCWFADVAGRQIAAATSLLPPDVVAAAQSRGRGRELWETARELLAELESN